MDFKIEISEGVVGDAVKAAKEMVDAGETIHAFPFGSKQMFVTTNRELINAIGTINIKGKYVYFGSGK